MWDCIADKPSWIIDSLESHGNFQSRLYRWFNTILSYLQRSGKWVLRFLDIKDKIFSTNHTVCSKVHVIRFKFWCNSMITQSLPNFKTQFSQKEEAGSYDNVALKQHYKKMKPVSHHALFVVMIKIWK